MSGRRFAEGTDVPVERSKAEIEQTLQRYGASAFGYGWNQSGAVVTFEAHARRVQLALPLPDRNAQEITHISRKVNQHTPPRWVPRTPEQVEEAYEQATRRAWRALALVVKAKLEAVASGISSFEIEFLAHTLVPGPDGRPVTVAESILSQVAKAYEVGGRVPLQLMPGE